MQSTTIPEGNQLLRNYAITLVWLILAMACFVVQSPTFWVVLALGPLGAKRPWGKLWLRGLGMIALAFMLLILAQQVTAARDWLGMVILVIAGVCELLYAFAPWVQDIMTAARD